MPPSFDLHRETGMKRGLIFILVVAIATLCLGMGGLGGHTEGSVPETDVQIQAVVTDQRGIITNLNQFSMDGKTYLDAWRGQGKLSVPFQQIDLISFEKVKGDEVTVDVKLKSGEVMTLTLLTRAQFYGSTGFGAFQIKSRDVATLDFP
jgi:hypothetical protein